MDIQTTNFPGGISSMGVLTFGVGGMLPFGGNYYWVDGANGSDGNPGTANMPFATITKAMTQMRSGYNDVCFFSNTVHITSTINWNLNEAHLIGLCAPTRRGKRARIAPAASVTGTTGFNNLVNVTGYGCIFANFGTFYGFSNTPTALTPWTDTGGRTFYDNVEFLGFGDATGGTGTANLTGARAFVFNTSTGEATFRNCVFGTDTVARGAANYTLEIAGGAPRMYFENCDFESYLGAGGTASSHLLVGVAGIDRTTKFIGCRFGDSVDSGASAMAQGLNVSVAAGGTVLLDQCTSKGLTAWQTAPTANVVMNMVAATSGGGLAHVVF